MLLLGRATAPEPTSDDAEEVPQASAALAGEGAVTSALAVRVPPDGTGLPLASSIPFLATGRPWHPS